MIRLVRRKSGFIVVAIVILALGLFQVKGVAGDPNGVWFTYTPAKPLVNQIITFTASCYGMPPCAFGWQWGDGSLPNNGPNNQVATHAYTTAGSFTVRLISDDSEGDIGRTSRIITVAPTLPDIRGWGGIRLDASTRWVNGANDLEAHIQQAHNLGYNAIRVSFHFVTKCSDPVNNGVASPYADADLNAAINYAKQYSFWIIIDNHAYSDITPAHLSCWLNSWRPIVNYVVTTTGLNYNQILWEPENEPCSQYCADGAVTLGQLQSGFNQWITQTRGQGANQYIVLPNLCINSCEYKAYLMDPATIWPIVSDPLNSIIINFHAYMHYPYWYTGWTSNAASAAAHYHTLIQNGLSTTQWQYATSTEMGADYISCAGGQDVWLNCSSGSPPPDVVRINGSTDPGCDSWSNTSASFVRNLTALLNNDNPPIGWTVWPTGYGTTFHCQYSGSPGAPITMGAFQQGGWGTTLPHL